MYTIPHGFDFGGQIILLPLYFHPVTSLVQHKGVYTGEGKAGTRGYHSPKDFSPSVALFDG